jgi:kynurenine formamidase
MARIHDLSVTLRPFGMESRDVELTQTSHSEAARLFAKRHGLRVSQLPCQSFVSNERVELGTHDGTHLDAPYHFFPTSEGKPAKLIDEVPLEWAFGDGLVLDFRHKPPHEAITEYDIGSELERIGRTPRPGELVMLHVGGTERFDDDPTFAEAASGMNGGALNYLFRLGVKVMSTDSATIDIPIRIMRERLLAGDKAAYFPIHRAGRLTEWTHAEKLANMASLPGHDGFKLMVFPIKIAGATGAWTRAVAVEDEWLDSRPVQLIDLSLPIMNCSFEPEQSQLHTVHHEMGRRRNAKAMGIKSSDVVHGSAMDTIETYTHAGTHVDAPAFFGAGKMTAELLPLDWFYADGMLLDFSRDKRPGDRITRADVQAAVERSGGRLGAGTIPLVRTGAGDAFADDPSFAELSVALELDAFQWLLDQGVRVVGCDAESLDGPVAPMVEALRSGRQEAFFPIHCAGRDRDFSLIHKMDLSGLGARTSGFKVAAFPIKLEGCGAAWTRAVALAPAG